MPTSASFTYDPGSAPLTGPAAQVGVFLFDPTVGYTALPNIQCQSIQEKDDGEPMTAQFSYILGDIAAAMGYPDQFEQLWPLNLPNPNLVGQYTVLTGDRICVIITTPDGVDRLVFDGFARMPQTNIVPDAQNVTFTAIDVSIRCWDFPITGRLQRGCSPATIDVQSTKANIWTDLPTRFNPNNPNGPGIQPNCSPSGSYINESDAKISFPVFLDENVDRSPDKRTFWSLSKVVKYVLGNYNPTSIPTNPAYTQFVKNPDFTNLATLLYNRRPKPGQTYFDPNDPSTYVGEPIVVRDFDATNMCWPDALGQLLGYYNFGIRFKLTQDDSGYPVHYLDVYRKDAANPIKTKPLFLPPSRSAIDPTVCNIQQMEMSFDYHGVSNQFVVETTPNRYEISVVLAPLFTPASGDETQANRKNFLKSNEDNLSATDRMKYRWYGMDECGDGHWDFGSSSFVTTAASLFDDIFPPTKGKDGKASVPTYCVRYRPGQTLLLTKDANGDFFHSKLALSRDYTGDVAKLWDGTGTWQQIDGDWRLLDDRLGIEVTAEDPEKWHIGKYYGTGPQELSTTLHGITCIANPNTGANSTKRFYLRLTTVIEGDHTIEATASRRPASPLTNIVQRRIDAKDHFRKDTIAACSEFNEEIKDKTSWDDTTVATDHASQLRSAHEFPAVAGTVTLPSICFAYDIGDRVNQIYGRDASLQTNAGAEQAEPPSYPFIVARTFMFSGDGQSTILQLNDRRLEPQRPRG